MTPVSAADGILQPKMGGDSTPQQKRGSHFVSVVSAVGTQNPPVSTADGILQQIMGVIFRESRFCCIFILQQKMTF